MQSKGGGCASCVSAAFSLPLQPDQRSARDALRRPVVHANPAVRCVRIEYEAVVLRKLQAAVGVHAIPVLDVGAVPDVLLSAHHGAEALHHVPVVFVIELVAVAPDIHQVEILLLVQPVLEPHSFCHFSNLSTNNFLPLCNRFLAAS